MDQTTWNFIFIGISFAVYITIAIWSRAASTKNTIPQAVAYHHLPTAWQRQRTGCQLPLLFQWRVELPQPDMEHPNFLWDGPGGLSYSQL